MKYTVLCAAKQLCTALLPPPTHTDGTDFLVGCVVSFIHIWLMAQTVLTFAFGNQEVLLKPVPPGSLAMMTREQGKPGLLELKVCFSITLYFTFAVAKNKRHF